MQTYVLWRYSIYTFGKLPNRVRYIKVYLPLFFWVGDTVRCQVSPQECRLGTGGFEANPRFIRTHSIYEEISWVVYLDGTVCRWSVCFLFAPLLWQKDHHTLWVIRVPMLEGTNKTNAWYRWVFSPQYGIIIGVGSIMAPAFHSLYVYIFISGVLM